MELQLGLALPVHNLNRFEGFDQTNQGPSCCYESKKHVKNKRGFEESFGHSLKPLPLLVWSGQPDEEDDRHGKKHRNTYTTNKNSEEKKHVVGWPPIKAWRKKKLYHQQQQEGGQNRNDRMAASRE